jgi:hypothetical protein
MSAVKNSDNVIALAPYQAARAARLVQRPALPYVLWYPGVGFMKSTASKASYPNQRTARGPERV